MKYFISLSLIIVIDAVYGQGGNNTDALNCHVTANTAGICQTNRTCEFTCKYLCCNVNVKNINVFGSGTYLSQSSVCRSALHDLRFSFDESKERKIKIRRFYKEKCFLEGSVKYGFSSQNIEKVSCDVFEFISPRISENILDLVSIHSNYIYEENEDHTQICVSTLKNSTVKFGIYSKWEKSCKSSIKGKETKNKASIRHAKVWSDVKSAGFQCFMNSATLSIITSIAFRNDASFFPYNLTIVANKNENVILAMDEIDVELGNETIWKKDDEEFLAKPGDEIDRAALYLKNVQESASGIYSLSYLNAEDDKPGFVQLIVRACPQNRYGDNCSEICLPCLNGGICHDITGECVCAPGFNGSLCENACKPGYLGKMCNIKCVENNSTGNLLCKGLLICLPIPYGCSCASGFTGLNCDEECPDHSYGAGCLQQHKHVHYKIGSCSKYFDSCDCLNGSHGEICNASYPILSSPPSVINVTANSISLSFSKWSNVTDEGVGKPAFYEVIYKEVGSDSWKSGQIFSAEHENQTFEVQLQSLKTATNYVVGVLVIDVSENKQEMDVKLMNATTACDAPTAPPSNVELFPDNQYVNVQWSLPPKENWNCWEIHITVNTRESFTNITRECIKRDSTSCFFYSDPFLTWIIEVCASTDGRVENCAKLKNITVEGTVLSSPIELEIIKREKSLSLTWVPPAFSNKLSHYVISYEDMDTNVSISITVQTVILHLDF